MDLATATNFIPLNALDVTYLLVVGFIGGLVSGFIGSGGAFVLTPAMMSMGVPGIVAVASNICHKFPKALVGADQARQVRPGGREARTRDRRLGRGRGAATEHISSK